MKMFKKISMWFGILMLAGIFLSVFTPSQANTSEFSKGSYSTGLDAKGRWYIEYTSELSRYSDSKTFFKKWGEFDHGSANSKGWVKTVIDRRINSKGPGFRIYKARDNDSTISANKLKCASSFSSWLPGKDNWFWMKKKGDTFFPVKSLRGELFRWNMMEKDGTVGVECYDKESAYYWHVDWTTLHRFVRAAQDNGHLEKYVNPIKKYTMTELLRKNRNAKQTVN